MGWARRWWWIGCVAPLACSMPNPAFMLGGPGGDDSSTGASDTMSSGTGITDSTSSSGSDSDSESMTGSTTTGVEPTTTSATDTTDATDATDTTGTTGTSASSDTSDSDATTDTEGVDEQELCAAAKGQAELVRLDTFLQCDEAIWGYQTDIDAMLLPTTCGNTDQDQAVIAAHKEIETSSGETFVKALSVAPALGVEGIVQAEYIVDLAEVKLPCFAMRIGYPAPPGGKQMILAQVSVGLDLNDLVDLFLDTLPPEQQMELVIPIPEGLRGEKIHLLLVTHKEGAPQVSDWALLWEQPRVFEGMP